jgi:hypothetical protein
MDRRLLHDDRRNERHRHRAQRPDLDHAAQIWLGRGRSGHGDGAAQVPRRSLCARTKHDPGVPQRRRQRLPLRVVKGASIPVGCVGPMAKCLYGDSFAFVGSAANEAIGVYVAGSGNATRISSRDVDDELGEGGRSVLDHPRKPHLASRAAPAHPSAGQDARFPAERFEGARRAGLVHRPFRQREGVPAAQCGRSSMARPSSAIPRLLRSAN